MIKCLACGYENDAAEQSCAQCASSLALKLCSVCEAVNGERDERCHSCGASLHAKAAQPIPAGSRPAVSARTRLPVLFIVPMAVVGAAAAFYFYGKPLSEFTERMLRLAAPELLGVVTVSLPPPSAPSPEDPETMPTAPAGEPLGEPPPPPDSMDKGPVPRVVETVSVPPASPPSPEHTETPTVAAAEPVLEPTTPPGSTDKGPAPREVVTVSFPPPPALSAPEPPVELSAPSAPPDGTDKEPVPGKVATPPPAPDIGPAMPAAQVPVTHTGAWTARAHPRVTHTKAPEAAADTTGVNAGEERPAACAPGVAALGLCTKN